MDAMDRMDDDGSPNSEEMHDAAAQQVEHAGIAEADHSASTAERPSLDRAPVAEAPVETPKVEQVAPLPATPPSAEGAPVAAAETATLPPPTPDPADHDPQ